MNYNQYKELMVDTIKYYMTEYQLQDIINNLIRDKLATYNRELDVKQISLKGIVKKSDKIEKCLNYNRYTFRYIESMEFFKGYRYSVYFKYDNLFEENIKSFAIKLDDCEFNDEIDYDSPIYTNLGKLLCIKFHKNITIANDNEQKFASVRYPVLFIFHKDIDILEARFDKLTYRGDDSFYKTTIEGFLATIKPRFKTRINNYDCDSIIKYIVDNKKDEVYESVRDIGLRGEKSAILHAGKDNIMPFIDDLEKILKNNQEIFNKNKDSQQCLDIINDYIVQVKRFSDYRMRVLTWLNYNQDVNNKNIDLKIIFNYKNTEYHLFNYYNPKITKMERMNYVIEYIIKTQKKFDEMQTSTGKLASK